MALRPRFWEQAVLAELSVEEWEALCDGCGKCCLHKLEDEFSGEVHNTRVACRLLDGDSCRCSGYSHRLRSVPECTVLEHGAVSRFEWLPATCAYRLVAAGSALPEWHYLECGDREEVHRVGASVQGITVSEEYVHSDDMEQYIIQWVE